MAEPRTRRRSSKQATRKPRAPRKWSAKVTETSDAMDLDKDIFKSSRPRAIATSLKHSAEHSHRRKSAPFRSAMSMLNFYINRAGRNLSASRRKVLEQAKDQLRRVFRRTKET